MRKRSSRALMHVGMRVLLLSAVFVLSSAWARGQDTLTGAFEGIVSDSQTGRAIGGANVEIINQQGGAPILKTTDSRGRFYQGLLAPGVYTIRVSMAGYQTRAVVQRLRITYTGEVVPVPVSLDPATAAPGATPTPAPPVLTAEDTDLRAEIIRTDGRRSGSFTEEQVATLPLGGTTLVRSFDELALLLPGVAPPPQTISNGSGPGVGAGVGSAGQFAVNGLRSRGNNFTVDGSDNNDEDIGVRRQGFVALIAQPVESVKEYQVTTLLAPAQFGRNIGAQVNAVSKSGGNDIHGALYGFFNSSQLNARNFFDTTGGNTTTTLRTSANQPVLFEGRPVSVRNNSGGKDSLTFAQGGLTLGGAIRKDRLFYFVSAEVERINAASEQSFAVPTVEQRGAFGTGATGIFRDPFTGQATATIPASRNGSAVFNLYPFPNNPDGVYGQNTFTQTLPASGRGSVLSGKVDYNFKLRGRQQSVTERYNFTDDYRDIPATGGALFSTLRPRVRTQNSSLFLNSEVTRPDARRPVFNQVRLSYGRTRLRFEEVRDTEFLVPSGRFPNEPFFLNAPLMLNTTTPAVAGTPNAGAVTFNRTPLATVEEELGPIGQVVVAGFSPVGVDVLNFPQRRVNNTYQVADTLTLRAGSHSFAFGEDIRRSELNSDLPRNSRPLVTFGGAPRLVFENNAFRPASANGVNRFIRPEDLAAMGAASNFYLTLNTAGNDANIGLRFYQLNFFAQDEWRVRRRLTFSYGLRYEYNTPVTEMIRRIENTFSDQALALAAGLRSFVAGRTRIYEPDRNNFAPRLGLAYSPNPFSRDHVTVIRGGYGLFYDQILGAVVSQSRNVFPTFVTLNFGGLNVSRAENFLTFFNPGRTNVHTQSGSAPIVMPGTINRFNPALTLADLLDLINQSFPSALGATLPSRRLEMPKAHHFDFTVEQQLGPNLVVTAAYVGTRGSRLLRFTTPNLGAASTVVPTAFEIFNDGQYPTPEVLGRVLSPSRPVAGVGAVNRFETTAHSRYDSLQLQMRGRLRRSLRYQLAYTLSKASDDVSDVFDLAGAPALPQNSINFVGEWGPANYDVRHRLAYNFIYDMPRAGKGAGLFKRIFGGTQLAGTGSFQTGQPFTVNSVFDVNLDGNLTDRLNSTAGLVITHDRGQPLRLSVDPVTLLAPVGQDGRVGRNTFRASNILELNLSASRRFVITSRQSLTLRADAFNFINRANFGIPVRFLEAPGFGKAANTVTPGRRIQLALKYSF